MFIFHFVWSDDAISEPDSYVEETHCLPQAILAKTNWAEFS